ncbi:hypothetical protein NL676_018844 [Syzygium grande]|nr:hypothetical protein NL676_018844 [Syzygium grande]
MYSPLCQLSSIRRPVPLQPPAVHSSFGRVTSRVASPPHASWLRRLPRAVSPSVTVSLSQLIRSTAVDHNPSPSGLLYEDPVPGLHSAKPNAALPRLEQSSLAFVVLIKKYRISIKTHLRTVTGEELAGGGGISALNVGIIWIRKRKEK